MQTLNPLDPSRVDAPRPTRVRYMVLGYLAVMAFILYLDRVCIAQALSPIQTEFGLTNKQTSYILMAFTLAYGLFEIPTGHWGDRYGSRRILTRIVMWWSGFTVLTAACVGFYSLVAVRFLFGAGEAGAFPNAARVISKWFPARERGQVQGLFQAASLIGGAVSPTIAGFLIERSGWRTPFVLFGILGVVWGVAFYFWFRDEPHEHPAVNAAEAELLEPNRLATGAAADHQLPWREILTHPTIWLLGTITSCASFNSYLYFSWYSKYLQAARGVGQFESGRMSSLVLTGGVIGTILGGVLVDRWVRRFANTVPPRRLLASSGMALGAGLVWLSFHSDSPWLAVSLACLSCIALFTQQTVWWSCATEVAGRYIGALFGLMNGLGVFGAMSSQYVVGAIADHRAAQGFTGRDQWDPIFYVFIGVLLFGSFCWLWVDPRRTVGVKREA